MQQKLCHATTKHDFARQDMHTGKRMSWKVVESRCNKNGVMQRLSTTLHDKKRIQANVCRGRSWKVDATKNCVMQQLSTTLHDKICMQANLCRGKQMQQKLCHATTEHDFARQETYAGRLMSWKVVKSREKQMQQKTVLCNDEARLYTTRNAYRQTYVVEGREK